MKTVALFRLLFFISLGIGLSFPSAYGIQNISVYGLVATTIVLFFSTDSARSIPLIFWITLGYICYLLGFEMLADQNWSAILKKIPMLLCSLLLVLPKEKEKKYFFWSIGIGVLFSCGYLWIHHFIELVPEERFLLRSYSYNFLTESLGWQPIYTAIAYSIGGLFWIDQLKRKENKWLQLACLIPIFFLVTTLVFLSARMALLAFLGSSLVLIPAQKRWVVLGGIGLAGVLIFINPVLNERILNAISGSEKYAGGSIRLEKWKAATSVSLNNLPWGVSSGRTQLALENQYQKQGFYLGIKEHYHAHQQWLQNLVEGGFLGLFFLGFVVFYFLKSNSGNKYLLLFSIGLFLLANTFTESICERQSGMIWFCVIFLSGFVQKTDDSQTV